METEISLREKAGVNLDVVVGIQTPSTGEKGEEISNEELSTVQMNLFTSSSTPAIISPSLISNPAAKPPSGANFRRRSLAKSKYSKLKSRIVEPHYPSCSNPVQESAQTVVGKSSKRNYSSPKTSVPVTPRTPLMTSVGEDDDGDEEMIVGEMNILTMIFLKPDNEKVYYPNAILATKPISNFNHSPEMMGDTVEFDVDFSTSVESIAALRLKIKSYLDSKPKYWRPGHSVHIKEIGDANKMKMALNVTHTINFQNAAERDNHRSNLVFELKKTFEELVINYNLLPQEVQISYVGSTVPLSITSVH